VPIDDIEEMHVVTTASSVVGIGTYVAAEAYAVPAGEDPAEQPVQALIFPYGIYPDMLVEDVADFEQPAPAIEGFTFEWTLETPDGSAAEVMGGQPVAIFMADVAGDYNLTLTATDEAGNSGSITWTVTASTYVGNGAVTGEDASPPQCAACHEDEAAAWGETLHATMFTRAIDGEVSDHYNANCITCHTTGFNNRPEAVNGGFDDVARDAGWEFPGTLQAGNWDAMVADYPEVAALANIQCESCHGPGADHNGTGPISRGLEYGVCAQCHAEEPYHVFPQQWELSPHADINARAFWYPIGENRLACVGCHTGGGFIDAANGVPQEERRFAFQVITCAVCHDPHDAANPNQLRVFDTITLPNGTEVSDAGPAATCMTCHNTRVDPVATVEADPVETSAGSGTYRINLPHYSSAAELLTGGNAGYTWGETLPSDPHGQIVENTCVGCHMAATPGMDDKGTEDTGDDEPLPGHNTVGQHTFLMVSPVDGTQNLAICQQCHGEEVASFDFEAEGDYDGDGTAETNHEEMEGLLELMAPELESRGVVFLESYPYYQLPQNADVNLKGAVFNYHLVLETVHRNAEVHNVKYLVALMQLSYEKLTGTPVPNAEIIPPEG